MENVRDQYAGSARLGHILARKSPKLNTLTLRQGPDLRHKQKRDSLQVRDRGPPELDFARKALITTHEVGPFLWRDADFKNEAIS